MIRLISLMLIALFAGLALAGCADSDKRSDGSRFSGFYGGMIGGSSP